MAKVLKETAVVGNMSCVLGIEDNKGNPVFTIRAKNINIAISPATFEELSKKLYSMLDNYNG